MKYSVIVSLVAAIPFVMGMADVRAEADMRMRAEAELDARAEAELDARDEPHGALMARACTKTSCNCLAIPNGLFCGDGLLGCKKGNVYQCGGDGKLSCNYGVRKSCQQCNKLKC